jgi:RNA 3'-phosphate cyclase
MISIDGSYLEGGGQIVRTAIALSAVTGKACRVFNIRAGRPNPGLRAQHLKSIEAVAQICNAKLSGAKLHSPRIEFIPGEIKGREYWIDVGTAGSIALVLQTLVIPAIHADERVVLNIEGGTDGKWAPTMAFFEAVFCANLKKMGVEIKSEVLRAGYYPKGGGKVKVIILPCEKVKTIDLVNQGEIKKVECWSFASKNLEKVHVAERQVMGFEEVFKKIDHKEIRYFDTLSPGSSITAHVHCNSIMGASSLGERGKRAEDVGRECAELLKKQIDTKATLDRWMADQILPYLALAKGKSLVSVAEITNHCITNMHVIQKFLPVRFNTIEERPFVIECKPKL